MRFEFRGALLIQTLGVLPLIMPPFVGAVALQLIFGRSGSVNLLLNDYLGFSIPIMDGLVGVTFVESIHYFPFILLNLVAAMRNIDGAMEESAMNLGARGWRLFWRIIFPLSLPGYLAGAALVFVKVFDDLGTPLVMGVTNMLAPQAYLRITSLEEAANSLGAGKLSTVRRIMLPLMMGGILAGFVNSFITAAVELSATILLTSSQSQAPMSYGIYLYMQSIAGRGPGAALSVIAVEVVALGT